MRIAIIGYGKMGHAVEQAARSHGHEISCIIDADNLQDFESDRFRNSDVAIEFTRPEEAADNIRRCFTAGIPVVSGTTGWSETMPEIKALCESGKGTLLWSSNFSIGVNIFFAANRYLARIMNSFGQYDPSITETHHIHKLDHPSGTAITTAEQILSILDRKAGWTEPESGQTTESNLIISHVREGENPGRHVVRWDSEADTIELTHQAKSRAGFAAGAVMAAEWLSTHKGFHTMNDIFNFD